MYPFPRLMQCRMLWSEGWEKVLFLLHIDVTYDVLCDLSALRFDLLFPMLFNLTTILGSLLPENSVVSLPKRLTDTAPPKKEISFDIRSQIEEKCYYLSHALSSITQSFSDVGISSRFHDDLIH
jgi:hypothetical protein